MEQMPKFKTVDEYITAFPKNKRVLLEKLRMTIKHAAPEAEEVISYNMPAFKYYGILVYFAAHKEHIGFYPGNKIVNEIFKKDLTGFETSKGTIKFQLDKVLPLDLIKKIILYKMNENLEKANSKKRKIQK